MKNKSTRLSVVVLATILVGFSLSAKAVAQDFGAVANGNWSIAATWTPVGGPPGPGQNAFIGSSFPAGSAVTATVTLTANQSVQDVHLGQSPGNNGTLNLAGNVLTVSRDLTIGRFGGVGAINRAGGHFEADELFVSGANVFGLAAADIANDLSVRGTANVTTTSTGNATRLVTVFDVGSNLNLGAGLDISQDLDIRGSAAAAATVNAAGQNIMARDIFIGRFGSAGDILNDNAIVATRNLEVSRGTFSLDANDSVAATLFASSGGTLNLHANTAAQNADVRTGAVINQVATANFNQSALLVDQGSLLNLGAPLNLALDLDIRGTGVNVASVNANGQNISARDIYIGRFGNAGVILNDNAIVATRNLEVSRGTFSLDANDSVAATLFASSGGTLNLHANTAAQNADVRTGAVINQVATANFNQSALLVDQGSLLNLGAAMNLALDLDIRGTGVNVASVNANGQNITARDIYIGRFGNAGDILNDNQITATRNLEVSRGTFSLDANDSVAATLFASNGGTLNLHANTAAQNADVRTGAVINQVATANFNQSALLVDQGSLLNLGAAMNLALDLDIRGTGVNVASVNANGQNITARDIYIGRFGNAGDILNDNQITATRNLEVSRGSFSLDANDSVAATLFASSGGTLNLHANTAAQNADVRTGAVMNQVATANFNQSALLLDQGSLLNLGAPMNLALDLDIRGTGANVASVNANGQNITARDIYIGRFGNAGDILNDNQITATRNLEVSRGTFSLDANDSVAATLFASNSGTLNLHANTAAQNFDVRTGGTMNTVATGNANQSALVLDQGSLLNLGAPLNLAQDLDIRGTGVNAATVNANGNDVTARDIYVGRFTASGALTNTARLYATRDLNVEQSTLQLDGGLDQVGSRLQVFSNSTLAVNQDADGVRGLSLEGSTLQILDTSVLALSFDNSLSNVGDWIFRWAGNRVADINTLIGSGRITVSAPHPYFVVNNGDGYTYIANFQADYNGDNQLNCADIDLLTAAIVAGSTDLTYDLTGDGQVTVADRDAWLAGAGAVFIDSGNPFLPGDANLDGTVDGSDFIIWNANKFTQNSAWCGGDFNTDGFVDGGDFILWNMFKFQSADLPRSAVPEPGHMFFLLGMAGWGIRARRVSPANR